MLEYRDQVLHSDAALRELAASGPDRVAELRSAGVPEDVLAGAARQISLSCLDHRLAEHLAQAADLREGIHLRALGSSSNPFGGSLVPVQEFNRELTELFSNSRHGRGERADLGRLPGRRGCHHPIRS